ncbi:MAG: DUF4368 domain-containing protein [Ruminococcus sp.]|nr:DUF4368 domain-containing protein [Ruminococcus sp.]
MYVKEFIAKAKTYIEMPELTPELLRVFIRRIEVYEKAEKYSRTCGNRIVIHYTFQAGSGQRADAVADEASEMALLPAYKENPKGVIPFGLHTTLISPLRILLPQLNLAKIKQHI